MKVTMAKCKPWAAYLPPCILAFFKMKQFFNGYCTICGKSATFLRLRKKDLRNNFRCTSCGSVSRDRHIAKVISNIFTNNYTDFLPEAINSLKHLKIYHAQSTGSLHEVLKSVDGYTYSEFFLEITPPGFNKNGIRCEDLQCLTFNNSSFDLIITQDVFEHIREPNLAWKEIYRVLKPGGYHIFSIPYTKHRKTVRRVKIKDDKDVFVLPKIFHGDNIRNGLVYTDFGCDLPDYLTSIGLTTEVIWSNNLYCEHYQIYESCVFISKKTEIPFFTIKPKTRIETFNELIPSNRFSFPDIDFRPILLLSPFYLYRRIKRLHSFEELIFRIRNVFILVWKILTSRYEYPSKRR